MAVKKRRSYLRTTETSPLYKPAALNQVMSRQATTCAYKVAGSLDFEYRLFRCSDGRTYSRLVRRVPDMNTIYLR